MAAIAASLAGTPFSQRWQAFGEGGLLPAEAQEGQSASTQQGVGSDETTVSNELAALISAINAFSRRLTRRLAKKDPDFRIGDWLLLKRLSASSPQQMAELARQMGVSRQRAQKQVSELLASNLVMVEGDPEDERRKKVALTEAGRERLKQMDRLIETEAAELPGALLATWRIQLQQLVGSNGR